MNEMFCPHGQNIRKSKTFQRDGPFVSMLDKSALLPARTIWRGQCVSNESKRLDIGNKIIIHENFLEPQERISFIQESFRGTVEKCPSNGHNAIDYTINGKPYSFSPTPKKTAHFKDHILNISKKILEKQENEEHTLMDSATEYEYGVEMVCGGKIEKTNDVAAEWGMVALYALGQTRMLRVTKNGARGYINIPLKDNSLVLLSGDNFQKNYYHQIDELPENHPSGACSLLKIRYRKSLLSGTRSNQY